MGVKGLTTFVASRSSVLGERLSFTAPATESVRETLIVDGNAFAYKISENVEWTRGGEAATLRNVVRAYVAAFRNLDLNLVFVWDGAFSMKKLDTVKSRIQNGIRSSSLYMRAGETLRSRRGFKREVTLLPLISLKVVIATIQDIIQSSEDASIELVFPGGEADPVIAELAASRHAYILSLDSDFFITSDGSKGYVPLDSLQFSYAPAPVEPASDIVPASTPHQPRSDEAVDDGQGWVAVAPTRSSRGRSRKEPVEVDTLPATTPETLFQTSKLNCKVYHSQSLATHLNIRTSWLPILAVLVGNDYYSPPFWRSSDIASRVEIIAKALLKCSLKLKKPLDRETLPNFMVRIVNEVRTFAMTDGQVQDVVHKALESLPQYLIHSHEEILLPASPPASTSPLSVFLSSAGGSIVSTRLLNAFESGHFRNSHLQIIATGIYAPLALLEDADKASCLISCGRDIRLWIYAILQGSIGIYQSQEHTQTSDSMYDDGQEHSEQDENTDENSDEDSQQSSRQDVAGMDAMSESPAGTSEIAEGQKGDVATARLTITEYVRRGAHLSQETVDVPSVSELLQHNQNSAKKSISLEKVDSILTQSTKDRYEVYLRATSSYTTYLSSSISGMHLAVLPMIVALRHVTMVFEHSRTQSWTPRMRRNVLGMSLLLSRNQTIPEPPWPLSDGDHVTSTDNTIIQRSAQITSTLVSVSMLAEALLLAPLIPLAEGLYEGRLFHAFWDSSHEQLDGILEKLSVDLKDFKTLVDIMEEGLPRIEEQNKKPSRKTKKDKKLGKAEPVEQKFPRQIPTNQFEMLSSLS